MSIQSEKQFENARILAAKRFLVIHCAILQNTAIAWYVEGSYPTRHWFFQSDNKKTLSINRYGFSFWICIFTIGKRFDCHPCFKLIRSDCAGKFDIRWSMESACVSVDWAKGRCTKRSFWSRPRMRHVRTIFGWCRKAFHHIKVDADCVNYCALNESGLKAVGDVEEEVGSVGGMEFDNVWWSISRRPFLGCLGCWSWDGESGIVGFVIGWKCGWYSIEQADLGCFWISTASADGGWVELSWVELWVGGGLRCDVEGAGAGAGCGSVFWLALQSLKRLGSRY